MSDATDGRMSTKGRVAIAFGCVALALALAAGWFFLVPSASDVPAEASVEGDVSESENENRQRGVYMSAMSADDDVLHVHFVQDRCRSAFSVHVDAVTAAGEVLRMPDGTLCSGDTSWDVGRGTELSLDLPISDDALLDAETLMVRIDGADYLGGDAETLLDDVRRSRASKLGAEAVAAARARREAIREERARAEERAKAEAEAAKRAEEARKDGTVNTNTNSNTSSNGSSNQNATPSGSTGSAGQTSAFDAVAIVTARGSSTSKAVVVDMAGRGVHVMSFDGTAWRETSSGRLYCDDGRKGTFAIVRKAPGIGNACADGFGAYMSAVSESFSADDVQVAGHASVIFEGLGHWVPRGICAGDLDMSGTDMAHSSGIGPMVDAACAREVFENVPVGSAVIVV